jgi:hypothetical protein
MPRSGPVALENSDIPHDLDNCPGVQFAEHDRVSSRQTQELLGHALDQGALRPGMVLLTGKGLTGQAMERHVAEQVGGCSCVVG